MIPWIRTAMRSPVPHSRLGAPLDEASVELLKRSGTAAVVVPVERGLEMFSAPRLRGVRAAADASPGARVEPVELAYAEESAAELAARWRELDLDAVFAYNDEYAMLLMRALQDAGYDIPGDVAVVGADDLLLGRLLRPRLTSVRIELPAAAEVAALVDRLIREPKTPPAVHRRSTVRIEARESSRPVAE